MFNFKTGRHLQAIGPFIRLALPSAHNKSSLNLFRRDFGECDGALLSPFGYLMVNMRRRLLDKLACLASTAENTKRHKDGD